MSTNTAETEDILKAIREMMGEESSNKSLPKDVLDLTEKVDSNINEVNNEETIVDNGILELTNIINDNEEKENQNNNKKDDVDVNIDNQKLESLVKKKIRSEYSSKIDELIKSEIESMISEKLSAIKVDFKNSKSS
jgi:hypothetical protein